MNTARPGSPSPASRRHEQATPTAVGFPGTLGLYVLYNAGDEFEGRRVYFTSSDPKVLALCLPGSHLEGLLLPEGACPPGQPAPRPQS